MREILFRGKRSDSKGWIEGLPTYLTEYAKDMNEIDGIQCNRTRFNYDIHFETVGQYTGLTDKNGTKIFEGDKVKVSVKNKGLPIDIFGKISWSDGDLCYMILWLDGDSEPLYGWHNKELEVIGNIHNI